MKHLLRSLATLCLMGSTFAVNAYERGERNTDFEPAFEAQFCAPLQDSQISAHYDVLAQDLKQPWGIDELPGKNGFLITELSGELRHLSLAGALSEPLVGVPAVHFKGQGGLMDVAVSPEFDQDRAVFLSYSKPSDRQRSVTAVARARLSDDLTSLEDVTDIFVQSPPSPTSKHYGSRIVFAPDGTLFITTGEHSSLDERMLSQDKSTTYGKVIRVHRDGSIPADNPFRSEANAHDAIWSLGHRNIQGAALDSSGELWVVEHGPKGGDELNKPLAGKNYGWPVVSYGVRYSGGPIGSGQAHAARFEEPIYFWDPVIAPGGMAFHRGAMFDQWNGDLLISAYVGNGLVRLELDEEGLVSAEERVFTDLGGIRDVHVMDDGSLLVLTDASPGKVLRISADGS